MAFTPFNGAGGGGAGSSDCTGAKAQALAGYTFITSDSDDEAAQGTIVTNNASGDEVLKSDNTSKSYSAGYYPNAHGAKINAQTKSADPSTSAQTIYPDSGKVLTSVTISAIANQTDGGTTTLNATTTSFTVNAGAYMKTARIVNVSVYDGTVS